MPRVNVGVVATVACGLAVALCGCGGQGIPRGAVIEAGSTPITKSELEREMARIAGASGVPGRATLEVPDPPRYRRCIAYKRANDPRPPKGQPQPTGASLLAECRLLYERVKLKAIYALIGFAWLGGKARELGLHASSAMVDRRLKEVKRYFPSEATYMKYLASEHTSATEMRRNVRLWVLTSLVQHRVEAQAGVLGGSESRRNVALLRFAHQFRAQWKAKTSCRRGYVFPVCRQYRRPSRPPVLAPPPVPLAG
jgi:hypothetical protein